MASLSSSIVCNCYCKSHLQMMRSNIIIRRTYFGTPPPKNNNISSRPFRSMLYVPASNTRALNKLDTLSGSMKPDAVMFDLEDGVAPDMKSEARDNLHQFLQDRRIRDTSSPNNDYFGIVRINRVDTPWFEDDALMANDLVVQKDINTHGVVLPKIEGKKDVDTISNHFASLCSTKDDDSPVVPLWAMIETPLAILSVSEIASQTCIQGLILGTNDLGKELRLRPTAGASTREGLSTSLQLAILAGRAYNKPVIDGVYNNFRDEKGFRRECMQGKAWGFDGKTLIHPNQISATNEILAPSDEEIEYAKRVVTCWEENQSGNLGVAVLDGMMIEQLHVDIAKRLLEQAERIESMV